MGNIKEDLKKILTLEDCWSLVNYLDGEPMEIKGNYFVSRTICHHSDGDGSYKLYCYDNKEEGQLFHCYSECGSFDIFELVMKVKNLTLYQSISFVNSYFNNKINLEDYQEQEQLEDWDFIKDRTKKEKNQTKVSLKIINTPIIDNLPMPRFLNWEKEGITKEACEFFNIRYDPSEERIVIPHYNINGELIGIRGRTLIKDKEKYGKYTPCIFLNKMFNHPLSYNLYGLNVAKENIGIGHKAIVFESEKSVLKAFSNFSKQNLFCVATCGSNLNDYQVKMLMDCGAEEIIIAFDRQYKEIGDDEYKRWVKKLKKIYEKFNNKVKISFIFDKDNMLDYKDAPIDKGIKTFMELYAKRIYL